MRAPLFLLIIIKNIVFFNRVGFVSRNGQECPEDFLVDFTQSGFSCSARATAYIVAITKKFKN